MKAPGDLAAVLALGDQGGHFGLGEHRAHTGNVQVLLRCQGYDFELVDTVAQRFCHDLQKLSGPGGATVVHFELLHLAVFEKRDGLAVLPADVQHGPGFGKKGARAPGVGLDLRDRGSVEGNLEQIASVSRRHDPVVPDAVDELFRFGNGVESVSV